MKKIVSALTLMLVIGYTNMASAHIISGVPRLTSGANSVDVYSTNCPSNTVRLEVDVRDNGLNNSFVSILVFKDNSATSTADPVGADPVNSPIVSLHKGGGVYTMFISHTGSPFELYKVNYHCRQANGVEVNPIPDPATLKSYITLQDQ